ncbi:MAG: RNA-binding S4 domain-containing protein [Colwellia sp.]|nr:RNA-binding S4 domain-containing protein [Colwellia sp.]
MSENYLEIQLDQQPIELCKLLKIADLVAGGGEAKVVISGGYVLLNGEVEYQKRKKVYHNDIVEFNGETLQVMVNENLAAELPEADLPAVKLTNDNSTKEKRGNEKLAQATQTTSAAASNEPAAKKSKRKPISF